MKGLPKAGSLEWALVHAIRNIREDAAAARTPEDPGESVEPGDPVEEGMVSREVSDVDAVRRGAGKRATLPPSDFQLD